MRQVAVRVALAIALTACVEYRGSGAERALYLDLRKIVEVNEDSGWIVDSLRVHVNLEPALHSVCQAEPADRRKLERQLEVRLQAEGGSSRQAYLMHGRQLTAASEALTIERTLALLQVAEQYTSECPFWLAPRADFSGQQADAGRWVVLAESTGFASLVLKSWIPAIGGGGRLLLGHGIGPQLTAAAGAEAFASGAFISTADHGFDATGSIAVPLLLRWTRFSRLLDLDLAPVMRFGSRHPAWPPGVRIQIGAGLSALRGGAFMGYTMFYVGYELHTSDKRAAADHTILIGTRLATDWAP